MKTFLRFLKATLLCLALSVGVAIGQTYEPIDIIDNVSFVALTPDKTKLVTVEHEDEFSYIKIKRVSNGLLLSQTIISSKTHEKPIRMTVDFSGEFVAIQFLNQIQFYNIEEERVVHIFHFPFPLLMQMFNKDGDLFLVNYKQIYLYDMETGNLTNLYPDESLMLMYYTPKGDKMFIAKSTFHEATRTYTFGNYLEERNIKKNYKKIIGETEKYIYKWYDGTIITDHLRLLRKDEFLKADSDIIVPSYHLYMYFSVSPIIFL
jgi:hypothetical protein